MNSPLKTKKPRNMDSKKTSTSYQYQSLRSYSSIFRELQKAKNSWSYSFSPKKCSRQNKSCVMNPTKKGEKYCTFFPKFFVFVSFPRLKNFWKCSWYPPPQPNFWLFHYARLFSIFSEMFWILLLKLSLIRQLTEKNATLNFRKQPKFSKLQKKHVRCLLGFWDKNVRNKWYFSNED